MKTEKQLSIRNTEAAELAELLSRELDRSQKQVVLDGLRLLKQQLDAKALLDSTKKDPGWMRFEATLRRVHEEVRRREEQTGEKLTSNHDDLYDEYGLPK